MNKWITLYPDFDTFKAKINAFDENLCVNTDITIYAWITNYYQPFYFKSSSIDRINADVFVSFNIYKNQLINLLNINKTSIEDLFKRINKSTSTQKTEGDFETSTQTENDDFVDDKLIKNTIENGGSNELLPSQFSQIMSLVGVENLYLKIKKAFNPLFLNINENENEIEFNNILSIDVKANDMIESEFGENQNQINHSLISKIKEQNNISVLENLIDEKIENNSDIKGPKGDIGLTGPKGDIGLTGPKGDIGLTGPKGDIGLTGPKGDIGLTGPKGDIGLTGPKGDKGDKGDKIDIVNVSGNVTPTERIFTYFRSNYAFYRTNAQFINDLNLLTKDGNNFDEYWYNRKGNRIHVGIRGDGGFYYRTNEDFITDLGLAEKINYYDKTIIDAKIKQIGCAYDEELNEENLLWNQIPNENQKNKLKIIFALKNYSFSLFLQGDNFVYKYFPFEKIEYYNTQNIQFIKNDGSNYSNNEIVNDVDIENIISTLTPTSIITDNTNENTPWSFSIIHNLTKEQFYNITNNFQIRKGANK